MKKIITAIANPKLNEKLLKEEEYEVIAPDIQYQDGVIEILEQNEEINILILNGILPGEMNIYDFINKIKKTVHHLKIVILLEEKNEEINNFLLSKGITDIFYNNEITIEELIEILKKDKNIIPEEINEEIKMLKEMILNSNKNNKKKFLMKNNKNTETKLKKFVSRIANLERLNLIKNKLKKQEKIKINSNKIINILGASGAGKTVFSCVLANVLNFKKILLIDFNISHNDIATIFGTSKMSDKTNKKIIKLEELIIKINNNLDIICSMEQISRNYGTENIIKNIKEISIKYDLVIIDLEDSKENKALKEMLKIGDKTILITEPNLLGIKRAKILLEKYINKWKVGKEKIDIIFNKVSCNSINKLLLKQLFSDFNILGEIKLNKKYDIIANGKLQVCKEIRKDYLKILYKEENKNGYEFISKK